MKRKSEISILLVAITLIVIFISMRMPINSQKIKTKFIAGENMGVDLTLGRMNFGKIVPGSSTTRNLTITNNFKKPTITTIESSGAISPYLIVSENRFILNPEESRNVSFSCFPPKGLELKEYSGEIIIVTKRTNFFLNSF